MTTTFTTAGAPWTTTCTVERPSSGRVFWNPTCYCKCKIDIIWDEGIATTTMYFLPPKLNPEAACWCGDHAFCDAQCQLPQLDPNTGEAVGLGKSGVLDAKIKKAQREGKTSISVSLPANAAKLKKVPRSRAEAGMVDAEIPIGTGGFRLETTGSCDLRP